MYKSTVAALMILTILPGKVATAGCYQYIDTLITAGQHTVNLAYGSYNSWGAWGSPYVWHGGGNRIVIGADTSLKTPPVITVTTGTNYDFIADKSFTIVHGLDCNGAITFQREVKQTTTPNHRFKPVSSTFELPAYDPAQSVYCNITHNVTIPADTVITAGSYSDLCLDPWPGRLSIYGNVRVDRYGRTGGTYTGSQQIGGTVMNDIAKATIQFTPSVITLTDNKPVQVSIDLSLAGGIEGVPLTGFRVVDFSYAGACDGIRLAAQGAGEATYSVAGQLQQMVLEIGVNPISITATDRSVGVRQCSVNAVITAI